MKPIYLLAMAGLFILTACTTITPLDKQHSGFLGDYSKMEKMRAENGAEVMRWINPDTRKGIYKKIIVHPVTYFPAPRPGSQVNLETLNNISHYLTEQIRQELSKSFEITDTPGPDTVNFRVAITGVSTPVEGLKFYEVIPIALVFAGTMTALGERDRVTVVYVEALATDSVTGVEIVKGMRQGIAESLSNDEEQLNLEKVKALLSDWAAETRNLASSIL